MLQINNFFKRRRKITGKENEFSPVERSILIHFCCFVPHVAFLISQIGLIVIGTLIFIIRETNPNSMPSSILESFSIEYFLISSSNPFLLLWVSVTATIFTICILWELFSTALRNHIFGCISFDVFVQKILYYFCFFCCYNTIQNRFGNETDISQHSDMQQQQPEMANAVSNYFRLFIGPRIFKVKRDLDSFRKPIFHPLTFKISLLIQFFAFLILFIAMGGIFISFLVNKETESTILLSISCFQCLVLVFIPIARFVAFTNNAEESDQQIVVRSETKFVIALNFFVRFFVQCISILFYIILIIVLGFAAVGNAGYRLHYYTNLHSSPMYQDGNFVTLTSNSDVKLFLNCQGPVIQNSTFSNVTIILESEINSDAPTLWQHVIPLLREDIRVCWYYRAGYGFSTTGLFPRTTLQLAKELYFLLQTSFPAQIQFIFVSVGSGARIVRQLLTSFQSLKPLGVVFIDETCYPTTMIPFLLQNSITQVQEYSSLGVSLSNIASLFEFFGVAKFMSPVTPYFTSLYNRTDCFYNPCYSLSFANSLYNNRYLLTTKYEYFSLLADTTKCQSSVIQTQLMNTPTVIVSSQYNINGTCEEVFGVELLRNSTMCQLWDIHIQQTGLFHYQYQEQLAQASNAKQWIIADNSRHHVPLDQPEKVVEAIRALLV